MSHTCEENLSGVDLDSLPTCGQGREPIKGWRKLHYLSLFVQTILDLSPEEAAVLEAVRSSQTPKTAAKFATASGVSRKKTNRILRRFHKRQLVHFWPQEDGSRDRWSYNRKLSLL
jgi:hypothetical protein